jgi:hypothetical protein
MSIKTMALVTGGTLAVTGGSALQFGQDGQTVANGFHVACITDTDFTTRRGIVVKQRVPVLDPKTSEFGKDKKSMVYVRPVLTPSGKVCFNTYRLEREVSPYTEAAIVEDDNRIVAQLLFDDEVSAFWSVGTME